MRLAARQLIGMGIESLIYILIVLLIAGVCFGIFVGYVVPNIPLPHPLGGVLIAVAALILIFILMLTLGGGNLALHR